MDSLTTNQTEYQFYIYQNHSCSHSHNLLSEKMMVNFNDLRNPSVMILYVNHKTNHTRRISNFLPVAFANFLSVENDGPLTPAAKLPSIRVIAVALVPILSASCACVNPADFLAAKISSSKANSSSMASYSALNSGLFIHISTISSCVIVVGVRLPVIFDLLHSSNSFLKFCLWGFLCFLDKAVQHDNTFTHQGTIKNASNAFCAFKSQFEKTVTEWAGMRFSEICTIYLHSFREVFIPNSYGQRKMVDIHHNLFTVVLNCIFHNQYNQNVMFCPTVYLLDLLNTTNYTVLAVAKSTAGICTPFVTRAPNRASGFFMGEAQPYLLVIMVGRAGEPKGSPGSRVTGSANPVRLTTHEICTSSGELSKFTREDAIMATTPTQTHPEIPNIYVSDVNLELCSDEINLLIDLASFLSCNTTQEARRYLVKLLVLTGHKTKELSNRINEAEALAHTRLSRRNRRVR